MIHNSLDLVMFQILLVFQCKSRRVRTSALEDWNDRRARSLSSRIRKDYDSAFGTGAHRPLPFSSQDRGLAIVKADRCGSRQTEPCLPHHLRDATRIVAAGLVDLRFRRSSHGPRLNAHHRKTAFGNVKNLFVELTVFTRPSDRVH